MTFRYKYMSFGSVYSRMLDLAMAHLPAEYLLSYLEDTLVYSTDPWGPLVPPGSVGTPGSMGTPGSLGTPGSVGTPGTPLDPWGPLEHPWIRGDP